MQFSRICDATRLRCIAFCSKSVGNAENAHGMRENASEGEIIGVL